MIGSLMTKRRWLLAGAGAAVSLAAIACGVDDRGGASDNQDNNGATPTVPPPQGSLQSGYDAVRQSLQAEGAVVVRGDEASEGIFKNPYTEVFVNGEAIHIYEFESAAAALEASLGVSADGTTVSRGGEPPLAIDFQNTPHYFLQGNVIVVYTGGDGETVEMLRSRLGSEFAGEKGAVVANPAGPGYETVVENAPIEGVKVVQVAPGQYILYVASGLPGGCASFEGINLVRLDNTTFELIVENRVPAPSEMVACTMIYGITENRVSVGEVGDELKACEVYRVQFASGEGEVRSIRFQAIDENVRCADPGLAEGEDSYGTAGGIYPGYGGLPGYGETPQMIISDVQVLLMALERMGIKAEWGDGDKAGTDLFGFDSDHILVNGHRVDVWVFAPGSSAWRAALGVAQSGYSITLPDGTVVNPFWVSTPHFYLFGNAIVLYVGLDEGVLDALNGVAQKFAGPDSKPLDMPIPVEPDGGIGDGAGTPGYPGDWPDRPVGGSTPVEPGIDVPPAPDADFVVRPAPVISVGEVAAAKSLPPQYFLQVRTAQPDGCHKDAGWTVKIDGTTVYVTVNNSGPADLAVVLCTMIYGETEHTVRLGTGNDFQAGVEYTVIVNGEVKRTFTGL